jgi:hypothetical protein
MAYSFLAAPSANGSVARLTLPTLACCNMSITCTIFWYFVFCGSADDHVQVRVFQPQRDDFFLQRGDGHFFLVQKHFAAGFDGDVIHLALGILRAVGRRRQIHVEVVHDRRRRDDEYHQQHKGEIQQRSDVQPRGQGFEREAGE